MSQKLSENIHVTHFSIQNPECNRKDWPRPCKTPKTRKRSGFPLALLPTQKKPVSQSVCLRFCKVADHCARARHKWRCPWGMLRPHLWSWHFLTERQIENESQFGRVWDVVNQSAVRWKWKSQSSSRLDEIGWFQCNVIHTATYSYTICKAQHSAIIYDLDMTWQTWHYVRSRHIIIWFTCHMAHMIWLNESWVIHTDTQL